MEKIHLTHQENQEKAQYSQNWHITVAITYPLQHGHPTMNPTANGSSNYKIKETFYRFELTSSGVCGEIRWVWIMEASIHSSFFTGEAGIFHRSQAESRYGNPLLRSVPLARILMEITVDISSWKLSNLISTSKNKRKPKYCPGAKLRGDLAMRWCILSFPKASLSFCSLYSTFTVFWSLAWKWHHMSQSSGFGRRTHYIIRSNKLTFIMGFHFPELEAKHHRKIFLKLLWGGNFWL